jgi:hypothetical protein
MKIVALVGALILFPIACFTGVKTLYHWWFVVTGVRGDKVLTASFLAPFCFLVPSLAEKVLEEKALHHLRQLHPWLLACVGSVILLFGLHVLAEHLG